MTDADYPALYRAANDASLEAQRTYFRCIKFYSSLSLLGALLTSIGVNSVGLAIAAAIAFAGSIALTAYMAFSKFDSAWYKTRAVAESIKTSTWKFCMAAEPFGAELSATEATAKFRQVLQDIIDDHKDLGHNLAGHHTEADQITAKMLAVRASSLAERIRFYKDNRIVEQRAWYSAKAKYNRLWGRVFFWVMIACQAIAAILTLLRIAFTQWTFWPISVFVVASTSILGWTQGKRFQELSAAYGLTAHEIGIAATRVDEIAQEADFATFVSNAELAFSREHTQWVARKKA